MPILSTVGRKSWSSRLFVWFLYACLSFFGATMVIPFLITVTGSATNAFDYERFSVLPRFTWSRDDRFVKGLVYFFNGYPGWYSSLRNYLPEVPESWTSWRTAGLDEEGVRRLSAEYLDASPETRVFRARQAADYAEFSLRYPLADSQAAITPELSSQFIALKYGQLWAQKHPGAATKAEREAGALAMLSESWGVPIPDFYTINFKAENRAPMGQQTWSPPKTPKYADYLDFLYALRHGFGTPGVLPAWRRFLQEKGLSKQETERLSPLPADASMEEQALWLEFARASAPASPVIPFPLRLVWIEFLQSDEARPLLGLEGRQRFDVAHYNALAGTQYGRLSETPFPLPVAEFDGLRKAWDRFVESRYPLRLTTIVVNEQTQLAFRQFLENQYHSLENVNRLLGTQFAAWSEFTLPPGLPEGSALNPNSEVDRGDLTQFAGRECLSSGLAVSKDTPRPSSNHRDSASCASSSAPTSEFGLNGAGRREVWMDFVRTLPAAQRELHSAEGDYQKFLLTKYGSLATINEAYGWRLARIEEARPAFDAAYAATYSAHALAFTLDAPLSNYHTIAQFLLSRGNAIPVTLWLILLSIFSSLTINPLAGYALSRFNLRNKDKIILFCLATSAFPAMVSAIPGYLLMRDLGLLNTFFALILPGAASGMSIFILKGFFDSLPQELYEAATIDGAKEWQIFVKISLPMLTPILAVNALNAFLSAYGSWEWALIVCQDKSMWTLSVWLYQASQWWVQTPWITTAGFVIASVPTLLVFLFCQKIILRGIVVPSMK